MNEVDIPASDATEFVPVSWMERDPARLARDQREVHDFTPSLEYISPSHEGSLHGGWIGQIPCWPFERSRPAALGDLLGQSELEIYLSYSSAHPMVPPVIYPLNPTPTFWERTQSAWHVAPDGSLCLLQSLGGWQPEASIVDLLLKAAGWRIEYALMKSGSINQMSVNGIVSDPSYDHLIAEAVASLKSTKIADHDRCPDAQP